MKRNIFYIRMNQAAFHMSMHHAEKFHILTSAVTKWSPRLRFVDAAFIFVVYFIEKVLQQAGRIRGGER